MAEPSHTSSGDLTGAAGGEWQFTQLVTGNVWLVRNGVNYVQQSLQEEDLTRQIKGSGFANIVASRTAIGVTKDGKLLLLNVDGKSWKGGFDLSTLADLLIEHGAYQAVNLDGGGSGTLLENGVLINFPSDKCKDKRHLSCLRPVTTIVCVHDAVTHPDDGAGSGDVGKVEVDVTKLLGKPIAAEVPVTVGRTAQTMSAGKGKGRGKGVGAGVRSLSRSSRQQDALHTEMSRGKRPPKVVTKVSTQVVVRVDNSTAIELTAKTSQLQYHLDHLHSQHHSLKALAAFLVLVHALAIGLAAWYCYRTTAQKYGAREKPYGGKRPLYEFDTDIRLKPAHLIGLEGSNSAGAAGGGTTGGVNHPARKSVGARLVTQRQEQGPGQGQGQGQGQTKTMKGTAGGKEAEGRAGTAGGIGHASNAYLASSTSSSSPHSSSPSSSSSSPSFSSSSFSSPSSSFSPSALTVSSSESFSPSPLASSSADAHVVNNLKNILDTDAPLSSTPSSSSSSSSTAFIHTAGGRLSAEEEEEEENEEEEEGGLQVDDILMADAQDVC